MRVPVLVCSIVRRHRITFILQINAIPEFLESISWLGRRGPCRDGQHVDFACSWRCQASAHANGRDQTALFNVACIYSAPHESKLRPGRVLLQLQEIG